EGDEEGVGVEDVRLLAVQVAGEDHVALAVVGVELRPGAPGAAARARDGWQHAGGLRERVRVQELAGPVRVALRPGPFDRGAVEGLDDRRGYVSEHDRRDGGEVRRLREAELRHGLADELPG